MYSRAGCETFTATTGHNTITRTC